MDKARQITNEKGMATIEMIPLILIFVFMLSYMLGAFGVIHTGIMHSISARAYAFETFRGRSNLTYFRDNQGSAGDLLELRTQGNRTHGVINEGAVANGDPQFWATERSLRMGWPIEPGPSRNSWDAHERLLGGVVSGRRNTQHESSPVWLMVQYGICLNVRCGD